MGLLSSGTGRQQTTSRLDLAEASRLSAMDPAADELDPKAIATGVVARNRFMTLATSDEAGRPWATPVWFATESEDELYWVSDPGARHSRNLAVRPELAIVIFDSTVEPGSAAAVYLSCTGGEVPEEELERGIEVFGRVSLAQGLKPLADPVLDPVEDVQHRPLSSLRRLGEVVAVERVPCRGQQPQPAPAAFVDERQHAVDRRLRDDHEVDERRRVLRRSGERVEERDARRARPLVQRQLSRSPGRRAGTVVAWVARKPEAVDRKRVLPALEQLRELHRACRPVEDVVLFHQTAGRQRPPGGRDVLHRAAQLDLALEQLVPRLPILG
jgi:hypothetical protein